MRVTFGKYKGLLVEEILDENAGWLVWAHENVEHFRLDEDIYQEAMARDVQRRARNEIKRYAEYNFWGDFDD
jgi:broad specificity phosphatase PhoE